jgi:hypothetical protein
MNSCLQRLVFQHHIRALGKSKEEIQQTHPTVSATEPKFLTQSEERAWCHDSQTFGITNSFSFSYFIIFRE